MLLSVSTVCVIQIQSSYFLGHLMSHIRDIILV